MRNATVTYTLRKIKRPCEVPESFDEAYDLLASSLDAYYDKRGGDRHRQATAARVAFGLFGENYPNPTIALVHLMMKICKREGAGLDDP